ncbi:MAG: xylose isomerase, partial [Bacteroidota bacterium]
MSSKNVLTGAKTFFPEVEFVPFEGKDSDNPFAFKYYNPAQLISGKSMADHFRFAIAYWHSFCGNGADPFGMPTRNMPWLNASNPMDRAKDKMDAAFEFITKIQAPYFCFHDFDLIEEGHSLVESEKRLQFIGDYAKEKMAASGVKVLWGTANLFSHPRYMNGAATNPDFSVVAYAAAQVKHALDISIQLGAENYVFWGGREGYLSLLNTDMKREVAHLATFLHAAKDYARSQGFKGHFFIEP